MHFLLLAQQKQLPPQFQDWQKTLEQMQHVPPGVHYASLIFYILSIIGMWKVFEKAGKPGWAALIPIYNFIVLLEIAGKPLWWILPIFLCWCVCIGFVFYFLLCQSLAKSFGRGTGFALGLFFLNPIFVIILGFGDDRYQGPAG